MNPPGGGYADPAQMVHAGGDVLEMQRQLTASEAYNRFMDRRVKMLERELGLYKEARAETQSRAKTATGNAASSAGSDRGPADMSPWRPHGGGCGGSSAEIEALTSDNTQLRVQLRSAEQERDSLAGEANRLGAELHAAETQLSGLKSQLTHVQRELAELTELLPPHLKQSLQAKGRRRGQSVKSTAPHGDNASETSANPMAADAGTDAGDRSGSEDGGGGDDDGAAAGETTTPDKDDGSGSIKSAGDGSDVHEITPLFDPSIDPKARATEQELRGASLRELTSRAERPPSVASATLLCDRTRQLIVDIRGVIESAPGVASQLQSARRNALTVLVEVQAATNPNKALRSRILAYARDIPARRDALKALLPVVQGRLSHAVGGIFGIATVIAGLAVRFPAASGWSTVKLLDIALLSLGRFSLFDVNHAAPLFHPAKVMSIDRAMEELADAIRELPAGADGSDVPRCDINELKAMSNECRETSASGPRLTAALEVLKGSLAIVADMRRLAAVPRSTAVIPDADEVDAAEAEDTEGGGANARRFVTRSTQVNFYLLKSMPTEADAKIARLAHIRQPWFECLQGVEAVSPRRRGLEALHEKSAAEKSAEAMGDGDDVDSLNGRDPADGGDSDSDFNNSPASRREKDEANRTGGRWGDSSRDLDAVIASHRRVGLPLPSNFARIRGSVFQFGDKRVQLLLRNGRITAKVGGGYVTFEEFCGMHYATEERRLRSPARTVGRPRTPLRGDCSASPSRPRLPDTPLVRNRRGRSRTPAGGARRAGTASPEGGRQMDDALREKLEAMGFTDDDFKIAE